MIVYKTINKINNKFYVGYDTKNDSTYLGSGKILKRAIEKYGRENFVKEILEKCNNEQELVKREIYWIDRLNATNKDIGYNIATGGNGGRLGDEVNEKRKKSLTGRKFSDEHKNNLSKSLSGRKLSDGHHKKIIESRKNNGKPWASDQWKQNQAKFMKGNNYWKYNTDFSMPKAEKNSASFVYEIRTPNDEIIKIVSRTNLDSFAKQISKNQSRGGKFRSKEIVDYGESKGYVLIKKYRQGRI